MVSKYHSQIKGAYRFSVAPMMKYTDSHYRVFMREICKRGLLYSEMIVANAINRSKKKNKLLDFNPIEHPIALQIGGDDPKLLGEVAKKGEDWGYDEINLNVGCPSPRVHSGNFGACLMANPDHVAKCIESMVKKTSIPITIKHRIGIDDLDNDELLIKFVDKIAESGAKRFSIHARKAWLNGLSPKENRTIPPLQYDRVINLKKERPNLIIELNGGLRTPEECLNALKTCDGAMVGRAAYSHPLRWKTIDEIIFGEEKRDLYPSNIIENLIPYTEKHLSNGGKMWDICKHLVNLVENIPGARYWRNEFSAKAQIKTSNISIMEKAALQLKNAGL